MNYMKQVAQMLGVKIGEEFELKKDIGDIICRFKLTPDGLVVFSPITEDWHEENKLLVDLLLGNNEIVKPILDDVEKEYLSNIIKPWRDCVKCITKYNSPDYEYIIIEYYDNLTKEKHEMYFPCFEKGKIYKGMKFGKEYSLDELGL